MEQSHEIFGRASGRTAHREPVAGPSADRHIRYFASRTPIGNVPERREALSFLDHTLPLSLRSIRLSRLRLTGRKLYTIRNKSTRHHDSLRTNKRCFGHFH